MLLLAHATLIFLKFYKLPRNVFMYSEIWHLMLCHSKEKNVFAAKIMGTQCSGSVQVKCLLDFNIAIHEGVSKFTSRKKRMKTILFYKNSFLICTVALHYTTT